MQTRPLRVTVLNWRDTTHPEGGGSERYIERIAADLVADGCQVEVLCSRHAGVPRRLRRDGVLFRHAGGRWTVYARALAILIRERLTGRGPDVIVDVHNGIPFFARLVAGCPVVVLVHHVHREQWNVVFGGALARFGWWLESTISPRVHRGCQYIAVSEVTRRELVELGVAPENVAIVHNGTMPAAAGQSAPDPQPSLVVLGRLVPHKRVEHALQALAALRPEFPGLQLRVIGDGWWRPELQAEADRLDVADRVTFTGFIDESTKDDLLARSWLMLAPSVKEGWGLMVVEAAAHGVPSIAYRSAGGLAESIDHGHTGLLVDDLPELISTTRELLHDRQHRTALGDAAREHVAGFSWRTASTSMHLLLRRAANRLPATSLIDPTAAPAVSRPERRTPDRLSDLTLDLRESVDRDDRGESAAWPGTDLSGSADWPGAGLETSANWPDEPGLRESANWRDATRHDRADRQTADLRKAADHRNPAERTIDLRSVENASDSVEPE
jgi:glycosyltransferase involved in cell wall biosynthesis